MAIEIITTEYEFSHGKKPRGYGCWAFFFGSEPTAPYFFTGSYTEAKKRAISFAVGRGETQIKVGS